MTITTHPIAQHAGNDGHIAVEMPFRGVWSRRSISGSESYLTISDVRDVVAARQSLENEGWKVVRAFISGEAPPASTFSGIPSVSIFHSTRAYETGAVLHVVHDTAVVPVMHGDRQIGCYIKRDDSDQLYLMDVSASSKGDIFVQTRSAYRVIDDVLGRQGFAANHVVRCWNYLKTIAESYGGFNRARDDHFASHGMTHYPAATGIESLLPGKRLVSISLEAIRPKDGIVDIRYMKSDLQSEAPAYGPKFSRGVMVDTRYGTASLRKIYISGTSHIDGNGESIISEGTTHQVSCTMSAIRHLLMKGGADLDDIAWSIAYCKDMSAYESFLSLYDSHRWQFPYLPVFVNICRPELNFEMECFAATK